MHLLALDFDGVVSDSAPEAFVVALRSWRALRPGAAVTPAVAPLLDSGRVPSRDEATGCALYADFVEMMPLGNRAEDYAVELHALEAVAAIADQAAYDAYKAALDADWLRSFHRRFYRERASLCDTDPAAWQALMGPYPGIADALRRSADRCSLAIATAKDRGSVRRLLRAYGIDDLFPEGRVLDKEAGVSKRSHLEQLLAESGLAPEQVTFVDDKLNHLDSVAPLGVVCALSEWGYNGLREVEEARRRGYRVLRLERLEAQLFDG